MRKIILISGPSCVGKGPLLKALKAFYPDVRTTEVPIIKSHESRNHKPRANETAIWNNPSFFMPAADINNLDRRRFFVGDCRGYPQAIDLEKLKGAGADIVLLEVYHTIGAAFIKWALPLIKDIEVKTVFVSPLSKTEMADLRAAGVDVSEYIKSIMIHKQIVRARLLKKSFTSEAELNDIKARAADACVEMSSMDDYTDIIVNHDAEGHANWTGGFEGRPEGDAARALCRLVDIIKK